jgi:FhuF 2Fe-2S C-terminal domain
LTTVDTAVLERLSRLGPAFAVDIHSPRSAPVDPWLPFSALLRQPGLLQSQVTAVRKALAHAAGGQPDTVEQRVAASVTQLALVARLLSPALAVAALTGTLVDLAPASLRWQPALGFGFPLSVCAEAFARPGSVQPVRLGSGSASAVELADALVTQLTGPVGALVQAFRAYSLSPQVLWGNVASALNGAATLIAAAEPGTADRTWLIADRLLDQPPLRGSSQAAAGPGFARLSCCLIYRLAPGPIEPVCGDCVLSRSPRLSAVAANQAALGHS